MKILGNQIKSSQVMVVVLRISVVHLLVSDWSTVDVQGAVVEYAIMVDTPTFYALTLKNFSQAASSTVELHSIDIHVRASRGHAKVSVL